MKRYLLLIPLFWATGTATAEPGVGLSPTALDFKIQQVGVASAEKKVTLKNSGKDDLKSIKLKLDGTDKGDFSLTTDCGTTLAPAASCAATLTFKPKQEGEKTASLMVTSNAPTSPNTVILKGTGKVEQPVVSLSPATLDFKTQQTGVASAEKKVTLKNSGKADLKSVKLKLDGTDKGDFSLTTDCGTTLAPAASCAATLTFKPKQEGEKTATLTVTSSAPTSPNTVSLKGTGKVEQPVVSLSPATLDFKTQQTGVASAEKKVTLKNSGKADLKSVKLKLDGTDKGDFSLTTDCGTTLAPAASCAATLIFKPKQEGEKTATLTVTSSAPTSPNTVSLKGTGKVEQPVVSLSPATLDFKTQQVGVTSAEKKVTLKNSGKADLKSVKIKLDGTNKEDFRIASDCGSTLAPAASCTATLTFTPKQEGERTAIVSVSSSAPASPNTTELKGTGVVEHPAVSLTPAALDFKVQSVGVASAEKKVTLKNSGKAELKSIKIKLEGTNKDEFSVSTTACPSALEPAASCVATVTFTPKADGDKTATLSVASSASTSPNTVSLKGTGKTEEPKVSLTPASVSFGTQAVKITSSAKQVTLKNVGKGVLKGINVRIEGEFRSEFATPGTACPTSLNGGESCEIMITFTPKAEGAREAALTVKSNATTSPNTVSLKGTGKVFTKQTYPSLGQGFALDASGALVGSSAEFSGGTSVKGGEFKETQDVKLVFDGAGNPTGESVVIAGTVVPETEDLGKKVDLFVVGFLVYPDAEGNSIGSYADCGNPAKGAFYMLANRASPTIKEWDTNPATLLPLDKDVTVTNPLELTEEKGLQIYKGHFYAPGRLCVYFAYQNPEGKLVFNGEKTINITISK